jgi:hypothetical protein
MNRAPQLPEDEGDFDKFGIRLIMNSQFNVVAARVKLNQIKSSFCDKLGIRQTARGII